MTFPTNATHLITGYAGRRHPAAHYGEELRQTWHIGDHSAEMEIAAWKARAARGEVSKIVVVNRETGDVQVITF